MHTHKQMSDPRRRIVSSTKAIAAFIAIGLLTVVGCGVAPTGLFGLFGVGDFLPDAGAPAGLAGPPGPAGELGETGPKGDPGASPFTLSGNDAVFSLGNVGIGTDAPACMLDVNGGVCVNTLQVRTGALDGGVLKSDATGAGTWQPDGLALPFAATQADAGDLLSLTNTDAGGAALFAITNPASSAAALTGQSDGTGSGVVGIHSATTGTAAGVHGETNSEDVSAYGVVGIVTSANAGDFSAGVRGINNGTGALGVGVYGSQEGAGWGVYGTSPDGTGVLGRSTNLWGVAGYSDSGTGVVGTSVSRTAGEFYIANSANAWDALIATTSGGGRALRASASGSGGVALIEATAPANNSTAMSVTHAGIGSGIAVTLSNAASDARGIDVSHAGIGTGIFASTMHNSVWGMCQSTSAAAILGDSQTGETVVGRCSNGGNGVGAVVGRQDGPLGYGVRGFITDPVGGIAVLGQSGISGGTGNAGRFENVNAANASDALVASTAHPTANAFHAITPGGGGKAGQFDGNVDVTGTLTKGGGAFKIDHPLDPENKYLYHSFVESPDMKNIYDGVVQLDSDGEATIILPDWFAALNRDFRYQLTAIGAPAPGLHIAQEITDNQFRIAGGQAAMKVSWQVTGIRHDAYANAHRIPLEVEKPAAQRGKYLHAAEYEMSNDRRIGAEAEVTTWQSRPAREVPLVSEQDLPAPEPVAD